jgi:hypothetical protein
MNHESYATGAQDADIRGAELREAQACNTKESEPAYRDRMGMDSQSLSGGGYAGTSCNQAVPKPTAQHVLRLIDCRIDAAYNTMQQYEALKLALPKVLTYEAGQALINLLNGR